MTADRWTTVVQVRYLTVLVHCVREGFMEEKILHTRAVNTSQSEDVIAKDVLYLNSV